MKKICGWKLFSFGILVGGIRFVLFLGRWSFVLLRWFILVYYFFCVLWLGWMWVDFNGGLINRFFY